METKEIKVQRFSVTSSKGFQEVVAAIEVAVGHPDMRLFAKEVIAAKTFPDMERFVRDAIGPSDLMEFTRMDLSAFLRKRTGLESWRSLRLIIGNPIIMSSMAEHVPDAGSYAPVTVLIDERSDGVHLSYDRMASYLATYGSREALKIAQDLDSKVEALLVAAAG
jgi:uncharacterized protein (DUF302 family)